MKPLKRSLIHTAGIILPFSLGNVLGFGELCVLAAFGFALNYLLLPAIHYAKEH